MSCQMIIMRANNIVTVSNAVKQSALSHSFELHLGGATQLGNRSDLRM